MLGLVAGERRREEERCGEKRGGERRREELTLTLALRTEIDSWIKIDTDTYVVQWI